MYDEQLKIKKRELFSGKTVGAIELFAAAPIWNTSTGSENVALPSGIICCIIRVFCIYRRSFAKALFHRAVGLPTRGYWFQFSPTHLLKITIALLCKMLSPKLSKPPWAPGTNFIKEINSITSDIAGRAVVNALRTILSPIIF